MKTIPDYIREQGITTFDTEERFELWMNSPIPYFNNKKPIEILNSPDGEEILMRELGQIEHGNFC